MEHFYRGIQGWLHCAELYREMVETAGEGAHFVEVGCWKGCSAAFMAVEIANSGKTIRFDCVDHWMGPAGRPDDLDVKAGTLYERFMDNLAPVASFVNAIRMNSVDAAALNTDGSLDFVYLDAGHDYRDVKADLAAWLPKMRMGSVIAGDDYRYDGVMRAVGEMFGNDIEIRGAGKERHWIMRL